MSPKLWNVREVAEYLNLAPGTIYHFLSERRIKCIRLSSRCVRFDPAEIARWVKEQTDNPVSPAGKDEGWQSNPEARKRR